MNDGYTQGEAADRCNWVNETAPGRRSSAIAVSTLTLIPALFFLYMAQRHLPHDEATRLERARALGEPMDELKVA